MKKQSSYFLTLILSLFVVGCASGGGTVKDRAAFDLDCPKDKIEVTNIGGTSYGASGCGKKATYTCNGTWGTFGVTCLKDSQE